ncbi:winged helix-turn-helix transcriptional regulator [Saccharopolyspora gloriosae]|uniref:winged helix-turn-helix transcriptional regulator n=1 Tax=Saccharopolyspora gloriosae TaxID=455344 RepID=UPI001FB6CAAB|nr:winged helix-turn-helix transcriptional regulator [Saccharopolyspora gloriosae]
MQAWCVEEIGSVLRRVARLAQKHRFNTLRRRIDDISEKMLAQTVHALEHGGLIDRTVHNRLPPHVECTHTDLDVRIATKLEELVDLVEAEPPAVKSVQAGLGRKPRNRTFVLCGRRVFTAVLPQRLVRPRPPARAVR